MSTYVSTIGSFSMVSYSVGPSVGTVAYAYKNYNISGLPSGAIIDSAILSCTRNNPQYGIRAWKVDANSWSDTSPYTYDATAKLQALGGVYGTVQFQYRFQASTPDGEYYSTLTQSNNALTIAYHMPASAVSLNPSSSVDAGSNVTVTITPGGAYTHKIIHSIGANSTTSGVIAVGDNTETISFPATWIPSATSATGTVVLETYDGATKIGDATATITVNVPSGIVPTITSFTGTHIRGIVPAGWSSYVKGKSKIRLDTVCAGASGSTIVSAVISGNASGASALADGTWSLTSGFLSTVGANAFTVTVTDSRGRTAQTTLSPAITVRDYYLPSATGTTAVRCLSDGTPDDEGTYLKIVPAFAFASVNGENSVVGLGYYMQMPSGEWIDAEDASDSTALVHDTPFITGGGLIATTNSYLVRVVVRDEMYPDVVQGEWYEDIGTSGAALDVWMNGTQVGVAVGGLADKAGFEIKGDAPLTLHGEDSDDRYVAASSYTAADVLAKIKTVDGSGSGLDADSVDDIQAANLIKIGAVGYSVTWGNPTDITLSGLKARMITFASSDATSRGLYIITVNSSTHAVNAFPVVAGSGLTLTSPGEYQLRFAFSGNTPDVRIFTLG